MTKELEKVQEYCKEKINSLDKQLNITEDVHQQLEILKAINTLCDVIIKCYDIEEE